MKFYIATKFQNKRGVVIAKSFLHEQGHEVPYDWSNATEFNTEQAMLDVEGVRKADALLGLFDGNYEYRGAIAEVGMAIALNKLVIIYGDKLDSMIFMCCPNVFRIKSMDQIPEIVEQWNLVP